MEQLKSHQKAQRITVGIKTWLWLNIVTTMKGFIDEQYVLHNGSNKMRILLRVFLLFWEAWNLKCYSLINWLIKIEISCLRVLDTKVQLAIAIIALVLSKS